MGPESGIFLVGMGGQVQGVSVSSRGLYLQARVSAMVMWLLKCHVSTN